MARYLPIGLNLESRPTLIIGGGTVACRRARLLFEAHAKVTVVASEVCEEMNRLAAEGIVTIVQERYSSDRLDGAFLVVACTDSTDVNDQVVQDCNERGILVNNAESGESGDLIIPSVIRRDDLLISVTTSGASPSLTAKIADELAERYGPEYSIYTMILAEARRKAKKIGSPTIRKEALRRLADDDRILEMVRNHDVLAARERALKCISSSQD